MRASSLPGQLRLVSAIAAVLTLVLFSSPQRLDAATRARQRTHSTASKSTATRTQSSTAIAAARADLAANRLNDAIAKADQILAKQPADEAAAGVKIAALLTRDGQKDALDAYDAFRKAAGHGSAALLAPIARNELRALSQGELTSMQGEALGALAADGDRAARHQLERIAASSESGSAAVAADEALARLGDAKAAERLVSFAAGVGDAQRSALLRRIAMVPKAPALALVSESLKSPNPLTQAAAADAAASLGLKQLAPELRQIMTTGRLLAQNSAVVALMRFGDAASKDRARALLSSPATSLRLQAARAFEAIGDRSWVDEIRPLLKDQDGLTRFQAAELLLPIDRAAAAQVLHEGLADTNPTIRAEATRILTADGQQDPDTLRSLLPDAAPGVRLLAANAVLVQARKSETAPAAKSPKAR